MGKFQNKYRIPSARLQHWDYRWAGAYFITICTQKRIHFLGDIVNQQMQLSHVGIIADVLWHQIPHHTKNIELGSFVVMPNHIHGILILNGDDNIHKTDNHVETLHATSLRGTTSLQGATSLQDTPIAKKNEQMANISPQPNSVSTIIRSYKSAVTKHAHRLGFEFQWQTRFHDHIIRDGASFQKINNYIITNPANWQDDTFFKPE
jgi:REP element-mobilizing transposase RayT